MTHFLYNRNMAMTSSVSVLRKKALCALPTEILLCNLKKAFPYPQVLPKRKTTIHKEGDYHEVEVLI